MKPFKVKITGINSNGSFECKYLEQPNFIDITTLPTHRLIFIEEMFNSNPEKLVGKTIELKSLQPFLSIAVNPKLITDENPYNSN